MIELIVWILREVFGSQEPPARVGPRSGSGGGPYGQSQDGGQPPKTLAELLQEARAELDGGSPKPAPPPPRPAPQVATRPPAPRPVPARRQDVPASRSTVPPPAAPVPQIRQALPELQHLNPLASIINQQATQQQRQQKRQQKQKKLKVTAGVPITTPAAATSPVKAVITPADKVLAPWLSALQSPKPELRRQAAMIGLVGGVVLGPPKCRQRRRVV